MKKLFCILLALAIALCAAVSLADAPVTGGWAVAESTEVNEELKALFEKAMEGLDGVSYEPVAYLGSQVVAGLNHCFLCRATAVYPDAVPTLALVYIYEGLDGQAEILNIVDLDLATLSVPAEPAAE